jgi:carboxymethylenebutenolidase
MATMIEITAPDGPAEAYLAGDPGRPGVLLFMDAIGLRPRIAEMADRIAGWGYTVLAPHVFYRHGSAAELSPDGPLLTEEARTEHFKGAMARVRAYTTERAAADADAWTHTLLEHATGPIGTTGYCFGGRLATRLACHRPDLVAAVGGWHTGGLVTDAPDSPHRGLPSARAEFVYGHADRDRSMPAEAVATLGEALTAAGLKHTNEIYPGAGHGYTMSDTAVYDEAATERHFAALEALLARTIGA